MIEIVEYIDDRGRSPFARWFARLKPESSAWVVTALTRVEVDGNLSDSKSVGKGVSELRINKGPGYRIYYGMDGKTLVVCSPVVPKANSRKISKKLNRTGEITNGGSVNATHQII